MKKKNVMIIISIFFISFSMLLGADEEKEIPNTDVNENPVREAKIIESNKDKDDKKLNLKVTKEFVEGTLLQAVGGDTEKTVTIGGISEVAEDNIKLYYNEYSNTAINFSVNRKKEELKSAMEDIKSKLTKSIKIKKNGNSITFPYETVQRTGTFFIKVKWNNETSTVYRIKIDSEGGATFCYGYNNGGFSSNLTSPPLGIARQSLDSGEALKYNQQQNNRKILQTNYIMSPNTSLASRVRKLYFEIIDARNESGQPINENNIKSNMIANVDLKSTDGYFPKSIIKLASHSFGMSFNLAPTTIGGNNRNIFGVYAAFATIGGFGAKGVNQTNIDWVNNNIIFAGNTTVTKGTGKTPNKNNNGDTFKDDRFSYNGVRYFYLKKGIFFEIDDGPDNPGVCTTEVIGNLGIDKTSILSAIDQIYYDIWGKTDTTLKTAYGENTITSPPGVYSMKIKGELTRPDGSMYFRGEHDVLVDVVDDTVHQQTDYLYNQADTSLVTKIDYIYPDYTEGGISFGSKYSDVYFSEDETFSLDSSKKLELSSTKFLTCNLDHVHNEKLQLSFMQNQQGEFATLKLTAVGTGAKKLSLEERLANEQQVYTFYLYQGRKVGTEDRIHKKIKYTLKHPNPKDIGTLKMQIDRRVLQHVSNNGGKKFVFGNGDFGNLSNRVNLKGYVKLDTSQINTDVLKESGNINEAVVKDKARRVYYSNYDYYYFGNDEAGGFSEDIGIKKGVPVATAGDTISIRVNKTERESLTFYIEDDKGQIYTGIGEIEYIGPTVQGYSGSGQIDISNGVLNNPYKFTDFGMSEDKVLKLEKNSTNTRDNYFVKEESSIDGSNLIDFFNVFVGEQQVHWANTINSIEEIGQTNKCAIVRNQLGIAIDKSGNLYLKKMVDEDFDIGWEKGNPITIKYYSVRQDPNNPSNKYDIKVGEFTFKVMNKKKSFEIDGSNVLDFGKIIQKSENQTVGVRQYFKVKNPDNLKLNYSLDEKFDTTMKNKDTSTDAKITMKSIDVKTLTKTDFYVEAEALVPANSPAGTYQGEIQVIVTVDDK